MSLDNEDLFVVQRDNTLFKVKSSDLKSTYASTAQVHVGDNPPANPVEGDLWWSSAQSNLFIWYDDGDSQQWVDASPSFVELEYSRIEAYVDQYVSENAVGRILAGENIAITPTTGIGSVTVNADLDDVESDIANHETRITTLENNSGGGGGGPISVPDASETVKGIVQLATASETTGGLDNTRAVHPAGLATALTTYAPKASPSFTGTPTAPTAASGTNNTQLATTAFVQSAVSNGGSGSAPSSASETVQGIVRLANDSETSNGTSRTLAVNPANLNSRLSNYATTSQLSNYATANDVQWHYTGGYLQPKNNTYQIANNGSIFLGSNPADPEMLLGRAGTFRCSNDIQCMGNSGLGVNTTIDSAGYGANFYKTNVGVTDAGFSRNLQIVSGYYVNSFGGQIGANIWGVAADMCMLGCGGDASQPYTTTLHNSNGSFRMGPTPTQTYTNNTVAIFNTGTAYFTGQLNYGSINQISDSRFKRDISTAGSQLADVAALGKLLKNFYYTDEAPVNDEVRATRRLGLLAQEAEIISPSLVKTEIREGRKESPGTPALIGTRIDEVTGEEVEAVLCHEGFEITNTEVKSISTDALVFKLLGAISELNDEVQALKAEHATLMNNNGGSSGGY